MKPASLQHIFDEKIMTSYLLTKKISDSIRTILLCLVLCNYSYPQDTTKQVTEPLPFDSLKGFSQTIYYSQGFEQRANNIAYFMEQAGTFFQNLIGFTPQIKLYILGPKDWKLVAVKQLQDVYGFPHNIDHVRLAIGAEDNDFWRSFLPPPDQLPAAIAAQVTKAYGKEDGTFSMMPFFDLLALHEMGHSYTARQGLRCTGTGWVSCL